MVTEDGRTYTAISRLPGHLGWQLQAAVPLGTVISWLFAKPRYLLFINITIICSAPGKVARTGSA